MAQVKTGDKVKVHYVGSLEDGTVFDSSREGEPMEFAVGERMLIPGFEDAVIGMSVGDSKTVSIPPEDAYGSSIEELVTVVERSQIPSSLEPKIGMMLQANSDDGMVVPFTVKEVTEDSVTLDGNHPLAGKGLTFKIELLEIAQ